MRARRTALVLLLLSTAACSGFDDKGRRLNAISDEYTVGGWEVLEVDANAGVLTNDITPGAELTASLAAEPEHGDLTFAFDGSFTYTPDAGFFGDDTFVYSATDGSDEDDAPVTITVEQGGLAAADDAYGIDEDAILIVDAAMGVLANDDLAAGRNPVANTAGLPEHGELSFNTDGSFVYTPEADFNGTDSFNYTVRDGVLEPTTATVTITVDPVEEMDPNVAPVAQNATYDTQPDVAVNGLVTAVDADGDPLTFAIVDAPQNGSLTAFDAGSGSFTYTPNAAFEGNDSFTFRANDGTANSNVGTVSLSVEPFGPLALAGAWIDLPSVQTGIDQWPFVMSLDNGNFLALWHNSTTEMMHTVFDSAGMRVLQPTQTFTDGALREFVSGDVFANGDIVIAYRHFVNSTDRGIRAQVFSPTLGKIGAEIVVYSGAEQAENAEAIVLSDDTFVVGYENRTAATSVLRRFNKSGVQQGVDYTLPESGKVVRLAALPGGGFGLVFQDTQGGNTVTRIYDNTMVQQSTLDTDAAFGLAAGQEIQVTAFSNGELGVVGVDVNTDELHVLRFNTDNTLKNDTLVTTGTSTSFYPAITAVDDGFFVSWVHNGFRGYGREYDAADAPVDVELTVFDHANDRTFIAEQHGAYYDGVLLLTGYDQDANDVFLRRLTK